MKGLLATLSGLCLFMFLGCTTGLKFPENPISKNPSAYDTNRDEAADYFMIAAASGRVDRIGYDDDGDGAPDAVISLDSIELQNCRHLVLILDGFGYEVVKQFYDEGHLRVFYEPSLLIATYPTMTDLCLEDCLGQEPCRSFEALYFDRSTNRIRGGTGDYLSGKNAPYNRLMQYRAGMIWDAIAYVVPWQVFCREINMARQEFHRSQTREMLAYFVSSAGVGTRKGEKGQLRCLHNIERFVNQIIWQTRGLVKITIFSDHGHSYTPSKRLPLEEFLKKRGWKITKSLKGKEDVVAIPFGLVTFAGFYTDSPAQLAGDLSQCTGVDLVSYPAGETVVVLSGDNGRAVVSRKGNSYSYAPSSGDPLKLADILKKPGSGPWYEDRALLSATAGHLYPAPLQRLWRAHFALAENAPDVIVSLKDEYFFGSGSMAGAVDIASTHGSLNYRNSATFIMSTIAPLPKVMKSTDVPGEMKKLLGGPWPMRK